mgnify:CR=1 FL=1
MAVKVQSSRERALELAKTGRRLLELRGWRVSRHLGLSRFGSVYVTAKKSSVRLLVRVSDHAVPAALDCGRRVLFCVDVGDRHPLRGLVAFAERIQYELDGDDYRAAQFARELGRSGEADGGAVGAG